MSVQGVPNSIRPFPELRPARVSDPAVAAKAAASPASASAASAAAPSAQQAQAPQQSTLWQLLTEDERAFFTQQAALGSATYRPSRAAAAAPTPGAPTGQRIDVRA
jgi:hypothetical protein